MGPLKRSMTPVRTADGASLITDKKGILERWADQFNKFLSVSKPTDSTELDRLPSHPINAQLGLPPTLKDISKAIASLKPRKSPDHDWILSELLVFGGEELHRFIHKVIFTTWNTHDCCKDDIVITL